uniref:Thyroglobulin type-1 domain-containing protein n=1 Tax=Glossina pallidipes TaxID=7398 RepID=A0A1B0A3R5_GLOPL
MLRYDKRWLLVFTATSLLYIVTYLMIAVEAGRTHVDLTACQHLRRAEARRSKALSVSLRTPRCSRNGQFEEIQCQNDKLGQGCWCVDEYGIEIPGTHNASRSFVQCKEPAHCPASACRMFCPSGFARDPNTGCTQCRCRDACEGIQCPRGRSCQLTEVKCKGEPCPPIPTCKKARSIANYCPAGLPLAIGDETQMKPFLCGLDSGKPQCPPLYQCLVEGNNDYGVCCPNALKFNKPGLCPASDAQNYSNSTGYICGTPCSHDLECSNMEKCCFTKGCQFNCQQPHNVTTCQQARALSDLLTINEREGRGYVPECNDSTGIFSPRQCSRNGLVCWCVDPHSGHKISGTMGSAKTVTCDGWENMISRSELGRSFDRQKCDTNICAAICEYGFKNDHYNCPTCECSDPCEGFKCASGYHCEVAIDRLCESGSSLCASWPICKPDLLYTNPCEVGTPLTDSETNEILYCTEHTETQLTGRQVKSFYDPEPVEETSRAFSTKRVICPADYECVKLYKSSESVCCPNTTKEDIQAAETQTESHQQTMCEYLRDFSERMEGTEEGMKLAISKPQCSSDGQYNERQCSFRKIKVTRAEQRKILEENTIRRMRMLLANNSDASRARRKRETERLKLYRVDDRLLKVEVAAPIMGRNAKVIDMHPNRQQDVGVLFETNFKKIIPGSKRVLSDQEIIELEVEECWCVDSFGTEIPRTRGFNITDEVCVELRESIECLDVTCRMGCEYGFILDSKTRCPACQCRDPCSDVVCSEMEECRVVEVSCDDEYCPPVPACLPRKPGQCPYLVPPAPDNLDANACAYECRTDSHCEGAKRCCSNGCGTQCVLPQMKTACQHLQSIQMHQSSELGIPVMKMHVAQCDAKTGEWKRVQCSPNGFCWCVDHSGQELSGTRIKGSSPVCQENSAYKCKKAACKNKCETGFKVNPNGCHTCECRNFCDEINCAASEECQLISVECVDAPCPKMPICVPRRESVCPEGSPLKQSDSEVSCGPHNENETCPTTHTCQLNPVTNRGVCCTKQRDVCFESLNNACLAKETSIYNVTRYRFSPKVNRCVAVMIDLDDSACHTKNLFENEVSCSSVCPILTQCERLKLKNNLAAQRTGHSSVWFKPRCDPVTGHWSPVQCLGKQPDFIASNSSFSTPSLDAAVCWCADKKGAPLKGTLTRDQEPMCNSRQGRSQQTTQNSSDLLMEELIYQITTLIEFDNYLEEDVSNIIASPSTAAEASVTERVHELANSLWDSQLYIDSVKTPLQVTTTRCRSLANTAPFPVSCDENGAFLPTQCNQQYCWCVDTAGNQLETSVIFEKGTHKCEETPISIVMVELYLQNVTDKPVENIYNTIRNELEQMLGDSLVNLRVQENYDGTGTAVVRFELQNDNKIDLAFALESLVLDGNFKLGSGHYLSDITRSQFVHRRLEQATFARVVSHEGTIQLALFITASSTAFLICVFVVYVMLKRGKEKKAAQLAYASPYQTRRSSLSLDSEFPAPIFVLSPEHDLESIRPPLDIKAPSVDY